MSDRVISILVLVLLASGSIYTAIIFTKDSVTVELSEGERFVFKDYEVTVQEIHFTTCLEIAAFGCAESVDVPNAVIRVMDLEQKKIDFLNLGEVYGLSGETNGLQVSQKEINTDSESAEIMLKEI